jgi:hypothetical protein
VSYDNDATSEVLEYVLYESAHELLRKIMILMMSDDSFSLQMTYTTTQYIVNCCQERFSGNALVIKSKEQCETIAPETNHLQEPKQHTEDAKLVCDISLSGNDSYYVETNDNLSAEALCLDTHLENINNDELEIEPCGTNMQGEECYDNSSVDELVSKSQNASKGEELEEENTSLRVAKEEYYEVYPLDTTKEEYYELYPYDARGKNFDLICKSLILLLKLSREASSLYMVHPPLLGYKNLFIYKIPMHRKRVRLRMNCTSKCSQPL